MSGFSWPVARSAYIHVPFCRHRCGYCNFSVVADRDDLIDRYLRAIDRELAGLDRPVIDTLFIGGGTPTHLDSPALEQFLRILSRRLVFDSACEWTFEANPEDISDEKLDLLAGYGVSRISLGVQSFDNSKLRILERGHTGDSARQSIEAVAARIANVSIDLIFAAPGETVQSWLDDLDAALALPITHLSAYGLTVEQGSAFWGRRERGELSQPQESEEVEMYTLARQRTAAAGLDQYEISSFARPGFRCRHNLAYWQGHSWYGAGPGAARFIAGRRELNHRSTTTYLKRIESGQSPVAEVETISAQEWARERAAFGVRMTDGIELDAISDSTGVDLRELCRDAIVESTQEGLITDASGRISLTEQGTLFADTVARRFLS